MPKIHSQIDTKSQGFAENRTAMLAQINELRGLENMIRARSEKSRERFQSRNQLLPRDRLELLLDRGASWLELSTTAGYKTYDDDGDENGVEIDFLHYTPPLLFNANRFDVT